jgi:uncharacterized Fe-S cluster-containing radical SAM superfamily protein
MRALGRDMKIDGTVSIQPVVGGGDMKLDSRASLQTGGYSIFFREWLATDQREEMIPISSVCNSRCLFCSNDLNPFTIHRGTFRDIEDVKLQLSLMPNMGQMIRMSSSPGRIAEGEAFLHPEFFDILKVIRRKFPMNRIRFTTNGSMLDEAFLRALSKFRPVTIYLSIHSTRPDLWGRIFGRDPSDAETVLAALKKFDRHGIDLVGAIVTLPRICGWTDIEHTFSTFVSEGAKWVMLYQPGYSRRVPSETVREIDCPLDEFTGFAGRMERTHSVPTTPYPYMGPDLGIDFDRILQATMKGNRRNGFGAYRRVLWLVSEAAHDRIAGELNNRSAFKNHIVFPVRNLTYGGNIIVSGLLMVDDFIHAGRDALALHPDTELILIPKKSFDSLGRDLTRNPAYRIAEELGRPAWLVSETGFINSLLEGSFALAGSSGPANRERPCMEDGPFNFAEKKSACHQL